MRYFFFLTFLITASVWSQTKYEFIDSKWLGNRELKIQLPRNYDENAERVYPLFLILDGDYLFETTAGNLDYMAYWSYIPDAIVVGINHKGSRSNDLYISNEDYFPQHSGAKFYDFIEKELMPYMYKNYKVGSFNAVVGHGDSANFINFFSFSKKPLFKAYIAMSPTLSTKMSEYLIESLSSVKEPLFYYLSTASEDYKENRKFIRALNTRLGAIEAENLFYEFNDFEFESHHSLVTNSIPRALQHIFAIYKPISNLEYKESLLLLSPGETVAYLHKKYQNIKYFYGIEKQILLSDFRAISSAIKKNKSFKEFKDMAKLARKNYPESLLSNLYLGWYYEGTGNIKKAIQLYEQAFILDEIDGIKKQDLLYRAEQLKAKGKN